MAPLMCTSPHLAWALTSFAGIVIGVRFGGARFGGPLGAVIGGVGVPFALWLAIQAFPPFC